MYYNANIQAVAYSQVRGHTVHKYIHILRGKNSAQGILTGLVVHFAMHFVHTNLSGVAIVMCHRVELFPGTYLGTGWLKNPVFFFFVEAVRESARSLTILQ